MIASLLFGWSFILFSWNLPSWLNFMSPGILFAVFSYSAALVFAQSLVFLLLLLAVTFFLPRSWMRD